MTRPPPPSARRSGPPGWLIGLLVALVLVVLGGAAAFAYFRFVKSAPQSMVNAGAPVPAASVGTSAASIAAAMAPAPTADTPLKPTVIAGPVASEPLAPPTGAPATAAPTQRVEAPPVDPTLQIASDLVDEGEQAYARDDYNDAVRHARSALDVHPGYADAERLLRRARDAQARIAEQKERAQRRAAEEQARAQAEAAAQAQADAARAAAAAAKAAAPTPDQIYNQRAHSECARGFFGKSCRHEIRVAVCRGAPRGTPGSTVCDEL